MRALAKSVAVLSLLVAFAAPAHAEKGVNVGVLNCKIDATLGLIIGSSTGVNCRFKPADGSRSASFSGHITKLGLSLGYTSKSYVTWLVFAAGKVRPDAIAGDYIGASADATVVYGVGANALIGGFRKTVALQPLSVQGQNGLNLAVGVTGLNLEYSGR